MNDLLICETFERDRTVLDKLDLLVYKVLDFIKLSCRLLLLILVGDTIGKGESELTSKAYLKDLRDFRGLKWLMLMSQFCPAAPCLEFAPNFAFRITSFMSSCQFAMSLTFYSSSSGSLTLAPVKE